MSVSIPGSSSLETAVHQMNTWGGEGKPFFFFFDFALKEPVVLPLDALHDHGIRLEMPGRPDEAPCTALERIDPGSVRMEAAEYPLKRYEKQFNNVVSAIRAGDSFLVNLTCETPVKLNVPLDDLYDLAKARYKLLMPGHFLVFSPETFVRIGEGIIRSCPMKGTIDATLPDAQAVLLKNPKEKAEHSTIVDLIRNDLSMVATNVRVARFRYVERVTTSRGALLQVSSEITGDLPGDWNVHIGDILLALLPAGSVTGAPKRKTVELICNVEEYERGYYTGVFGVFDGKSLDSAVAIRFLEQKEQELVYKSGGGITAFSQMESEYQEMKDKIYVPVY